MNDEITRINHLVLNSSPLIELCRLLRMSFLNGENFEHPIGRKIQAMDTYHQQYNELQKELLQAEILFLIKYLQKIEKHDTVLLDEFRKIIQKVTDEEYFGVLAELAIADRLIKENIEFKKRESPDYKIHFNKNELFIESTSTHITHTVLDDNDPKKKIRYAINKKSSKSYCNNNTALFIDITNLYFRNTFSSSNKFEREKVREYVKKYLQKTNFGNITLFTYQLDPKDNTYYHNYIRIDNQDISSDLKTFLDKLYPFGNVRIDKPIIPDQP